MNEVSCDVIPLTELEDSITRESAKMSWPGHMHPMLQAGAKNKVEKFWLNNVDLRELQGISTQNGYDRWHEKTTCSLAEWMETNRVLRRRTRVAVRNDPDGREYSASAIAAKLIDTFVHQLSKHPPFHGLYLYLHLPYDEVVRGRLCGIARRMAMLEDLAELSEIPARNAYTLGYHEYSRIQQFVWKLARRRQYAQFRKAYGDAVIWLNAAIWAGA